MEKNRILLGLGQSYLMSNRATAGAVIEGKYRLERELGAGGMGAVWLATQVMVDRKVAVKLLHPAFLDQKDLQARFEVEARAIGRLSHPNCITLYDFGFSKDLGAFYTVIEFVNGESLDKRLGRHLPLPEVISIIKQIALALDHAHHQGILHRDLKPENVMLAQMTDGSELVKVLDFGIARMVKGETDGEEAQRITKAGEVFGTPAYMSPEQARSTRQLGPPTDLYSLGVMFYELVAGNLPFFSNSAFDLLMMHVTKPVPPIIRHDVPVDIKNIIMRLLEKEPEKRFQTGKELAKALDRVVGLPTTTEEIQVQNVRQTTPVPTLAHFDTPVGMTAAVPSGETSELTAERAAFATQRPSRSKILGVTVLLLVMVFGAVGAALFGFGSAADDPPQVEPATASQTAAVLTPDAGIAAIEVPAVDAGMGESDTGTAGDVGAAPAVEPEGQTAAQVADEPAKPAAAKTKTRKRPKKTAKTDDKPVEKPKPTFKSLSPDSGKREIPNLRTN